MSAEKATKSLKIVDKIENHNIMLFQRLYIMLHKEPIKIQDWVSRSQLHNYHICHSEMQHKFGDQYNNGNEFPEFPNHKFINFHFVDTLLISAYSMFLFSKINEKQLKMRQVNKAELTNRSH